VGRPQILRAAILDRPGLAHGFTTRHGGVSRGHFASLNLSGSSGDEAKLVEENRSRVASALGLECLVFARQVHGGTVLTVGRPPGPGERTVGEGDVLITDRPGVGLAAQTADCTPVLIFDPEQLAVAAVHAGWRGAAQNAVGSAVAALADTYGSRPADLLAALGPAISRPRYRVGPEVLDALEGALGSLDDGLIGPLDVEGGATLDVPEAVRRQLIGAGLREENIERVPACTYTDQRFYSSRRARGHPFGAQAGVIGLTG
jgi:YfiH family protein